ncbi:hypothetical protein MADE_1014730 [Alteromonas mediterranea DE]|uniref:Uncharacterized protein n=1 Tax=Alteromonas mediterranea (strain DSM 17117 / CIP 110805 / LMG 28347 / Deep ecotype) TaxID=1774373 RepID=F2GCC4_ALTMD|nr:hypothetical protein MADE_1014730 [Alteromonas mediterranea DE]
MRIQNYPDAKIIYLTYVPFAIAPVFRKILNKTWLYRFDTESVFSARY